MYCRLTRQLTTAASGDFSLKEAAILGRAVACGHLALGCLFFKEGMKCVYEFDAF